MVLQGKAGIPDPRPVKGSGATRHIAARIAKAHRPVGDARLPPPDRTQFTAPRKPSPQGARFWRLVRDAATHGRELLHERSWSADSTRLAAISRSCDEYLPCITTREASAHPATASAPSMR